MYFGSVRRPPTEVATERLRKAGWQTGRIDLAPGEQAKSLALVSQLYDALVELKADRRTLVVAVGGGVTGDTTDFVAATYGNPFRPDSDHSSGPCRQFGRR